MKQLLSEHVSLLKKNGDGNKPKVETVTANLQPPVPPAATTSVPAVTTVRPSIVSDKTLSSSSAAFIPISDYAWDQGGYNSPTVSIFIDLPGVGAIKDRVEFSCTPSSFDLKITGLDGKNYRLVKDSLDKDIVPAESKIVVKKDKVVIKLQKVKGEYSYEHWAGLTSKNKRDAAAEVEKKKDPMGKEFLCFHPSVLCCYFLPHQDHSNNHCLLPISYLLLIRCGSFTSVLFLTLFYCYS